MSKCWNCIVLYTVLYIIVNSFCMMKLIKITLWHLTQYQSFYSFIRCNRFLPETCFRRGKLKRNIPSSSIVTNFSFLSYLFCISCFVLAILYFLNWYGHLRYCFTGYELYSSLWEMLERNLSMFVSLPSSVRFRIHWLF